MYTVKCRKTTGVQTGCSTADLKDQSTQCDCTEGSYLRNEKKENFTTCENLLQNYLWNKDFTFSCLKDITLSRICTICGSEMKLVESGNRSDGYVWECRKQINGKQHRYKRSIRKGSWFEKANLTIEEVLKFTSWWC